MIILILFLFSQDYMLQKIIKAYDMYAEECFNDSTEVTFGYYRDIYNEVGSNSEVGKTFGGIYTPDPNEIFKAIYTFDPEVNTVNLIRTEKGYLHRQPTFIGFIEYIRNKEND